ncbi:P-loop containing nucleoside triphosphate hydrolase protein [Stachybotrys elegans]|uniref:ATP-dependent RNA helicase n=1 Tax=Stachybotrys elegans TaxID=80388 RepID=A0A8K0T0W2_9HYPO|nr:P-loop containing nucleoside triphosphate hydrolase protein [Stachybotrys elegans]
MFRQVFQRCARQAGTVATASMLRSRIAVPAARSAIGHASPLSVPLKNVAHAIRTYSAEAAAVSSSQGSEAPVSFRSLEEHGVDSTLLRAIDTDMGYEHMSPVQAKTIHPALKGSDIVAQARTGTGKTLAFLLPIFQRMLTQDPTLANRSAKRTASIDDVRGIVLSPTRELAEQIAVEARRLAARTGIVVQTAVGGTAKRFSLMKMQREGCHLLVATPGRLNDLLEDDASGVAAPNLDALVLDEADRMLDVGFERELNDILSHLPKPSEHVRQTMLVSATIPDNVIRLARNMVRQDDFEFVQTIGENETLTHDKIPQNMVAIDGWGDVVPSLYELISREIAKRNSDPSMRPFKAIVYLNNSATVDYLGAVFDNLRQSGELRAGTYHISGKMMQNARFRAADGFRKSRSAILLSSDVTARGMDFPDVTHVIQIDTPRDRETYIHRLGRTGRQNKDGEGWLFLPPLNTNTARRELQGLPIQKNESLECANASSQTPEAENARKVVAQASRHVAPELFEDAYGVMVSSQTYNPAVLIDDLNDWATKRLGLASPPAVSYAFAAKRNLLNTNLTIRPAGERFDRGDRGFGRDGRDSGRRFGGRDRNRESSDPFSEMRRNIRRDDHGGRDRGRGGRGGRGGFGDSSF